MKKLLLLFSLVTFAFASSQADIHLTVYANDIADGESLYLYSWVTIDGVDIPTCQWPGNLSTVYDGKITFGISDFYHNDYNYIQVTSANFLLHRGLVEGQDKGIGQTEDFHNAISGDIFVYGNDGSLERKTLELFEDERPLSNNSTFSEYMSEKNFAYFGVPSNWNTSTVAAWPYSAEQPNMAGNWPGDEMTYATYHNGFYFYRWTQPDSETGTPEHIIFNNNVAEDALQSKEYDFVSGGIYLADYGLLATISSDQFIKIDETNFPDENFRKFVAASSIDRNTDGYLSPYEISQVQSISLKKQNIGNIQGIGFFNQLRSLDLSDNSIHEVDFSGNPLLSSLTMESNNTTTSLDLRSAPNLTFLDISDNDYLEDINLSGLTKLKELNVSYTLIGSLDISEMTELEILKCSTCRIPSLDLSNYHELKELNCSSNGLNSLNLDGCDKLTKVDCSNNNLTSLDLSNCTELAKLNCEYNRIANLNLTGCEKITTLNLNYNCLKTLDVTNMPLLAELEFKGASLNMDLINAFNTSPFEQDEISKFLPFLQQEIGGNEIETIDLSNCPKLRTLNCNGNKLSSLDLSNCPDIVELDAGENLLTSVIFNSDASLRELDLSSNNLTTVGNLSNNTNLTELSLSGNPLSDITAMGIQSLSDLSKLKISHIDLSAISDIATLVPASVTKLEVAGCNLSDINLTPYASTLKSLDISNNNKLNNLDLKDMEVLNTLTAISCELTDDKLTLPDNGTELEELFLIKNQLTSLNLSKYTKLNIVNVKGNQLTELTFPTDNEKELGGLDCSHNKLASLDLTGYKQIFVLNASDNELTNVKFRSSSSTMSCNLKNNKLSHIDLANTATFSLPFFLKLFSYEDKGLGTINPIGVFMNDWTFNDPNSSIELFSNYFTSIARGKACGNPIAQIIMALFVASPIAAGIDDISVSFDNNTRHLHCDMLENDETKITKFFIRINDNSQPEGIAGRRVKRGLIDSEDMLGEGFDLSKASDWTGATVTSDDRGDILELTEYKMNNGIATGTVTYKYNTGYNKVALIQGMTEDDELSEEQIAELSDLFPSLDEVEFSFTWESDFTTGITTIKAPEVQLINTTYYNAAGIASNQPFSGMNIVVKEYNNGTKSIEKLRF